MARVARLPFAPILWLVRLYRRRISVQLIASHVLVVLLTALLVGFTAAVVFTGPIQRVPGADNESRGLAMSQDARSFAAVVGPDAVAQAQRDGAGSAAATQLDRALDNLVRPERLVDGSTAGRPIENGGVAADRGFVVDRAGTVIASTDDTWAPVGRELGSMAAPAQEVARRVLVLDGQPSGYGNLWVYDTLGSSAAIAYPILDTAGHVAGVVVLQGELSSAVPALPPLRTIAFALIGVTLVVMVLLMVPAVAVSIPIGVLRGRGLSRRLTALAEAADGMAQGDLARRVRIRGQDEVARLGERFNDMVASLERTDRARRAFVANVSHDLRTPVAVIRGHVEHLLAERQAGNGRHVADPDVQALEVIHEEVVTLGRLIDDLFILARLDEAALPFEPTVFPIDEVANQAVEGLRRVAWDQRKVTVQSVVPVGLPPVRADRTRLQQIFGNLLYNALRHTPEGGLVIVDARPVAGAVEVSVSDTGTGIPEEERGLVFERFYRNGDGGERAAGDGAGLGLAIVKQLVEAQHGTIAVDSVLGEGTTFRFTVPTAG